MKNIELLVEKIISFISIHQTDFVDHLQNNSNFSGNFSLYPGRSSPDLYGMIDAAFTLFTINQLENKTDHASRSFWAKRILGCQADNGWFTKNNLRGHSKEHATAYALSALQLLSIEENENYIDQINPIPEILSIVREKHNFWNWIEKLDFEFNPHSILKKRLGWHYIWRGSHVGGGIAAIIGMTEHLFSNWWGIENAAETWYSWYIEWLNQKVNPETGYWQLGVWNKFYIKPTLIDMGGAVHFYWIYEKLKKTFPYPEELIESTLSLQKNNGLYKNHPFCIDLDGNFCVIRSFLQLDDNRRHLYKNMVYESAERNFAGIINVLLSKPLDQIYKDSHGLPGALAALVECTKLPDFKFSESIKDWNHPLDKTWWL